MMTCNVPDDLFKGCTIWATKAAYEEHRRKHECGKPAVAWVEVLKVVLVVCKKHMVRPDDPMWNHL